MTLTTALRLSTAVLASAVLGIATAAGAQASVRAASGDAGVPAVPDNAYTAAYDFGGTTTATVGRLGATATLPASDFLSYLRLCTQVSQLGSDDPAACPDFRPPTTSFDSLDNENFPIWIQASGPIWVRSPDSAALQYGTFPTVRVTAGNGSAAADVTITQPVGRDGTVRPLNLSLLTTASPLPAQGGTISARGPYPAVTFPANNGALYLNELTTITGSVDVRLSKVTIAGRPVDVGPACSTSTPAPVALRSPSGVYDSTAAASTLKGRPGGFQPFSSEDAGSIQGTVSIPAFSGCRSGNRDVSALVTALVSGPRNAVDLGLTRGFTDCTNPARTQPCAAYPSAARRS